MHESEWADVVAQARGRWAEHETFDLFHLFTACLGLHLIAEAEYPSFLSDARRRSQEGGELAEEPNGKWRAHSIEEEEEDPLTEPQEPVQEPQQLEAEAQVPDDPDGAAPEEGKTYDREIVVERQGQGQWAIWDSASEGGAWETIGKEQDAIKEGRTRAKTAGVEARMRVVGMGRKVKYERVYSGKAKPATRTKASPAQPATPGPVPPPLPGEDPPAPVAAPIPEPVPVEDDRAPAEGGGPAPDPEAGDPVRARRVRELLGYETLGLVLIDLNGDGNDVAAIDPAAVVAIVPDGSEYVGLHMQGGAALKVKADLLTLVSLINRGRE